MEKRKKWDLPHWVTPGVFSGHFVVDEAVERISIVKPGEKGQEAAVEKATATEQTACEQPAEAQELVLEPKLEIMMRETDVVTTEQLEKLEQEVAALKESLAAWEKRWKKAEEEQAKERQYLYQVVLSLKKEWESERNEHRHN